MIKILVVSDTHGNMVDLSRLNEMMQESDYVFHLGDHYDDMRNYYFSLKDKIYRVHGNCDWGTQKDIVVNIGEHKILATHGDLYSAKRTTEKLVKKAKEEGCDVVFYGHTHIPEIREEDGVLLVNPGTLSKYSVNKTFAYVVFSGKKIIPIINDKFFKGA